MALHWANMLCYRGSSLVAYRGPIPICLIGQQITKESGQEWPNVSEVFETLMDAKNGPRYYQCVSYARYG